MFVSMGITSGSANKLNCKMSIFTTQIPYKNKLGLIQINIERQKRCLTLCNVNQVFFSIRPIRTTPEKTKEK